MSYQKRGYIVQGAADAFVAVAIDTNLTAEGKSGWQIESMSGYFVNGELGAAADADVNLLLTTQATVTVFSDEEEIYRLNWAVANTAGVAVAYPLTLVKREELITPRLTVQPIIHVQISSTLSGIACAFYYEFTYSIVKLTDLEVLRMMQGGV